MDQMFLETALKMMMALGAVLILFGAAVFLFRKFAPGNFKLNTKFFKGSTSKAIEVMATQNLGPGRALYLVRCQGKTLLIGASNQQVSHIADISESELEEESFEGTLRDSTHTEKRAQQSFKSNLKDIARV